MERSYAIDFDDRCGASVMYSITAMPDIAAILVAEGMDAEIWLDNIRGHMRVSRVKTDRSVARVFCERSVECAASDADVAWMNTSQLSVIKVAYPSGHYKLYYPLSYKEMPPYEGRQWMSGESDCYRLVLDYYKRDLGVQLPVVVTPHNYAMQTRSYQGQNLFLTNWEMSGFKQVLFPQPGDAILIRAGNAVVEGPDHCAIYLEGDQILHHFMGRLSTIQQYAGVWRDKSQMVLRHNTRM